jgi:hypothetical protein
MATDLITPQDSSGNYLNGEPLPLGDIPVTIAWSGGFPTTFTCSYYGNTYVQTFTNDGTNITHISGWVKQ